MEGSRRHQRPDRLLLETDEVGANQTAFHRQGVALYLYFQPANSATVTQLNLPFQKVNKPITVKILVTVNDPAQFDACTLCFESLRAGWPTADIHVYFNGRESASAGDKLLYCYGSAKQNMFWHYIDRIHLAEWQREQVEQEYPGPLVIADPDIVYWKSCEDWKFPESTLLAGYYNPRMWNDFARCVSVPRIHTSMMVFPDVQKLWTAICHAYPLANMKHGEYCPCDPFMGRVMFEDRKPVFWDCCANLYSMLDFLSPSLLHHFSDTEKACFDHLNSASFYDVMYQRLEGPTKEGFAIAHRDWVKRPTPGLWPLVDEYYEQKRIEGLVIENPSQIPTTKL